MYCVIVDEYFVVGVVELCVSVYYCEFDFIFGYGNMVDGAEFGGVRFGRRPVGVQGLWKAAGNGTGDSRAHLTVAVAAMHDDIELTGKCQCQ